MWIGLMFTAFGVLLGGFFTYLEAYTSVLMLWNAEADAHVIRYVQDSPGWIREGDWRMQYEFRTDEGVIQPGHDVFAPKKRPGNQVQTVRVCYLPFFPSVSAVKGNITYTGLMGYLVVSVFIYGGLKEMIKPTP